MKRYFRSSDRFLLVMGSHIVHHLLPNYAAGVPGTGVTTIFTVYRLKHVFPLIIDNRHMLFSSHIPCTMAKC